MNDELNNEFISLEEQKRIKKSLRENEIKKLLKSLTKNNEQITFFNWENDTDINPDFELWEQEMIENY